AFYALVRPTRGCCWPLNKWCGPDLVAARTDRQGELQALLCRGERVLGPMSRHGKNLWSEVARQDWVSGI
ncbi:hypothetical protein B0H67DRAFT_497815, partial [Lasiosphaeris hirsuta]